MKEPPRHSRTDGSEDSGGKSTPQKNDPFCLTGTSVFARKAQMNTSSHETKEVRIGTCT